MNNLLTPQPPPQENGNTVYYHLLASRDSYGISQEIFKLLYERYIQGLEKYGQPLMSDDGRDTMSDLIQEIIDGIFYAQKGVMQGKDLQSVIKLLFVILEMVLSTVDTEDGNGT